MKRGNVTIIRGIPGSGKTHWGRSLFNKDPKVSRYCSNDDYFMVETPPGSGLFEYQYDTAKRGEAVAATMRKYLDAVRSGIPEIIVDNTHTRFWEYENFIRIAELMGYAWKVVEMDVPDLSTFKLCVKRNRHEVPVGTMLMMWYRWEVDVSAEKVKVAT
jgi:hypothetical protein